MALWQLEELAPVGLHLKIHDSQPPLRRQAGAGVVGSHGILMVKEEVMVTLLNRSRLYGSVIPNDAIDVDYSGGDVVVTEFCCGLLVKAAAASFLVVEFISGTQVALPFPAGTTFLACNVRKIVNDGSTAGLTVIAMLVRDEVA